MKTAARIILTIAGSAAIGAGLITFSVHAQSYGPAFRVEYNTDRPGSDIKPGFGSSLQGCMNECAFSRGCRAFTWVDVNRQPPAFNNGRPLCWLKDSVPIRQRGTGMITGVRE